MKLALTAAVISLLAVGAAHAADPFLPPTGSAQGITVPHALPGEPTHKHNPAMEGHVIAPTGQVPQASERAVNPANSVPGNTGRLGGLPAHADVESPRAIGPDVGSEQGIRPSGSL